ncbi:MAG: DegV family protein [Caldicoprobacterales bacterium]|nr:DegV family protein [Clostridiales bacterium]
MQPIIITDSCSDLPLEYVRKRDLPILSFTFNYMGEDRKDDLGQTLSYTDFYNGIREGHMSTTSQVNSHTYVDFFRPYVELGKPIIYMCFSSALSGSYNNAVMARQMLLEEYPEASISIIDTLSASMGQGLLVHLALELRDQGFGYKEIIEWIENNKRRLAHWFTVDDLEHLRRGGRLSGAAAFIGSILSIKPILHVDSEGRLVPVSKVKGRKKSLKSLLEKMQETAVNPEQQTIFISHGDAPEDANYLADMVRDQLGVKNILINHIGPVIGSHSGPGTVALFFFATQR